VHAREFLRRIPDATRATLPARLGTFRTSRGFSIMQLWYGNRSLHYEAWMRSRLNVIEIGLHFEADPLTNARLLAAFQAKRAVVRRSLGTDARIEAWDKGWARVWEPVTLPDLDDEFLDRVTGRMGAYIRSLEPILRDALPADVAWREPKTQP
jgi:hypothetical protein